MAHHPVGSCWLRDVAIYFHYPNYPFYKRSQLDRVILQGDGKLIKRFDDNSLDLYDLSKDITERNNLATRRSNLTQRLERNSTNVSARQTLSDRLACRANDLRRYANRLVKFNRAKINALASR